MAEKKTTDKKKGAAQSKTTQSRRPQSGGSAAKKTGKKPSSASTVRTQSSGAPVRSRTAHAGGRTGSASTAQSKTGAKSGGASKGKAPSASKSKASSQTKPRTSAKSAANSTKRPQSGSKSSSAAKKNDRFSIAGASKHESGGSTVKVTSKNTAFAMSMVKWTLVALLVIYVGWMIYYSYYARLDSEMVLMVTVMDSIETQGIAVRDETVITTEQTGVMISTVGNGGKVSKGEAVANIFPSAQAAQCYIRVQEIDKEIEQFENMRTASAENAAGIAATEKQLRGSLVDMSRGVLGGDVRDAIDASGDILYLLNKNQVATKVTDGFDERIAELRAEREQLLAQYSSQPTALASPGSGYYISNVDGYEHLLSMDMLPTMTPEQLDAVKTQRVDMDTTWTVGKIADDYVWDIVCEVTSEEAELVKLGNSYRLHLPWSDVESITGRLKYINPGADTNRVLLIFECTYMVSELAALREQPVTIELSSYTGMEISKKSLTRDICEVTVPIDSIASDSDIVEVLPEEKEEEEAQVQNQQTTSGSDAPKKTAKVRKYCDGVYIIWGNEVKFKRVNVIYETEDKIICEYKSESGWLKLYDKVATNTRGLYDGKVFGGTV